MSTFLKKIAKKKIISLPLGIFLALSLVAGGFFAFNAVFAGDGVTISPTFFGENISIDTTTTGGSGTFVSLNGPGITETAPGSISAGTHTFTLPLGWEFDTSSHIGIFAFGGNISLAAGSNNIIPETRAFSFTVSVASEVESTLGFSNLKVRPTAQIPSSNVITHSGAPILGVIDGITSFGTLSTIPGTVTQLAFTTQPGGAVYGSLLNAQPVVKTQDKFGNNSTNGLAVGATVLLSLPAEQGNLLGTLTLPIGSGTASYADLKVDLVGSGKQLAATSGTLAPATSLAFNISVKPITGNLAANIKPYDGNAEATFTGVTLNGIEGGDTVSAVTTGASATFANANAEVGKTVTAVGVTIDGADALNYTLGAVTGTANIEQLPITVSADAQTRTFGESDPALNYQITSGALVNGDSLSGNLSRAAGENVGAYAINQGTLNNTNYSITFVPENLTIITRDLTVTATGINKVYDRTNAATVNLADNRLSGDDLTFNYTSTFADEDVATGKVITVSGISISGGADQGNYNLANNTTTTSANITVKPLTVSFTTNATKTYNGLVNAVIHRDATLTLTGVIDFDNVTITTDSGSASFADRNVGDDKTVAASGFTLSGNDKNNYAITSVNPTICDVLKKAITITAVMDSKTYEGLTTSLAAPTYTELASGDIANFTQTFDSKNAGNNKVLMPSGTVNDGNNGNNYSYTYNTVATGVITVKTATVTALTDTKIYDGSLLSDSAPTVTGLVSLDTEGTAPTQAYLDKNVGTGKILRASGLVINDGNGGANYSVSYVDNNTGVITALGLTVSGATPVSKVYDGGTGATVNFGGASLTGVVGGDIITLNSAGYSASYVNKNAEAGKTVTIAGLALADAQAGNYSLTQPTFSNGEITQKSLTVTATGINKDYNASLSATVTLSSADKIAGDNLTYSGSALFLDKNVGEGKTVNVTGISIGGTDAGNYSLVNTTAATTANITAKTLTTTITVATKVYDGNNTARITGVTLNEKETLDVVIADYAAAIATFDNAGPDNDIPVTATGITIGGADAGNYSFDNSGAGTGDILPVPEVVYVDDGYSAGNAGTHNFGYDAFNTIQAGINAVAPGGEVEIAAGTYSSGFSIVSKNELTLSGSGAGTTIIDPTTLITSGITHKYTANMKTVALVNNSTDIEISDLTIKSGANAPGFGGPDSILLWNDSNGSINDCAITGAYAINGQQTGQGIALDAGTGKTSALIVADTIISGFQKNGIDAINGNGSELNGGTINLSVVGGSITGAGATDAIAQNGIVVWNRGGSSVSGTISGTEISQFNYTPLGDTAAGALAYGGGILSTVRDAKFSGNELNLSTTAGSPQIDARENWWNSTDISGIAPYLDGQIIYRPWRVSSDMSIFVDSDSPSATISGQDYATVSPVQFTVIFGKPVYDFTAADLTVTNGVAAEPVLVAGTSYEVAVTPAGQGNVSLNLVAEKAWDINGNYNTASNMVTTVYDSAAPTLTTVTIASDNANTALAKVDNTVTLTFVSSENIQTPTVTIATQAASVTGSGVNWTATYQMGSADIEGALPFSIAFSDLAGNAGTAVNASTNASSVKFDKTAPTTTIAINPSSPDGENGWYITAPILTLTCTDQAGLSGCGTIKFKWNDAAEYSDYSVPVTAANGQNTLYYYTADNAGNAETVKNSGVLNVDTVLPAAELNSTFSGGVTLTGGNTYPISWVVEDSYLDTVDLEYTTNNIDWYPIATDTANDGRENWTVPSDNSSNCFIRVIATDLAGNISDDPESDDFSSKFSISYSIVSDTQAPSVTLTSPNGGETWETGSSRLITWTATDNMTISSNIKIDLDYSTDAGSTWINIVTDEANDGAYDWKPLPGEAYPNVLVKITASDTALNEGNDTSNSVFSIIPSVEYPDAICGGTGNGPYTCVIQLSTGWNLISLPVVPQSTAIVDVLDELSSGSTVSMVKYYDQADLIDGWRTYVPGGFGDLDTMEAGKGYWVDVDGSAGTLTVTGNISSFETDPPPSYHVNSGWNLIGFKSAEAYKETADYLSTLPSGYVVLGQGNVNKTNGLMQGGNGYWLWVNSAGDIVTFD